jgi:hypothetical protein
MNIGFLSYKMRVHAFSKLVWKEMGFGADSIGLDGISWVLVDYGRYSYYVKHSGSKKLNFV